ncbi:MAG TPA: proprotein convertase P-domain-containing protein [Kofleriaceae bacterium]|nr:proprotein convertase P-domain-containing protein [Kofleriaceae bacterium]
MRTSSPLLSSLLLATVASGCAADAADHDGLGLDNDPPLARRDDLFAGAPKADEIPREFKADEVLPPSFTDLVAAQSPVKSQGSRGVCSIFSTVGLMEHLYISAGADDPDFSEQYLQWSAKFQVGAFRNTSGSSASVNLDAVNRFGIVIEQLWPYESVQWGPGNDPDCDPMADGDEDDEGMPTKCYTNGAPPAAAQSGQKFRLPAGRFLSVLDVKSHLKNRRTAVIADLDFFYQSWNHRRSTLPTNRGYWDQGYVLYPNDTDKRVSLEKRAGHSIVLVGWDDTLEVPIVDENGEQVIGSNGEPVVERGFYLFKNSWGTAGFGIQNDHGAGYGWISQRYVREFGSIRISDKPAIERPGEICDDGRDNDGNGDTDCDDAACSSAPECQGGGEAIVVDGQGSLAIPDNDPAGISSAAVASEGGTIVKLMVNVDIDHTFRGDLRVSLHKGSKAVVLSDRAGGGADDLVLSMDVTGFAGEDLAGEWRLVVADMAGDDVGTLRSWSLEAIVE